MVCFAVCLHHGQTDPCSFGKVSQKWQYTQFPMGELAAACLSTCRSDAKFMCTGSLAEVLMGALKSTSSTILAQGPGSQPKCTRRIFASA
ncbi:unnamed protein product [Protopolystoma xenopodis]|uniref:Uncharacterized protein n=1 Tax=Protopolystoma xenopodis TaxID=117903 RepID=A0A448WTX9_9PLAT|nr:unnamed protein product [Protopolystoma xenopodis]